MTALALVPLVFSACGGGSDSTSSQEATGASSQGSREETIRSFGSEASGSEAAPLEAALHGYLDVLSAGRWNSACSYLSVPARHRKVNFAKLAHAESHSCAAGLRKIVAPLSSSELAALAKVDVSSVRVEGDRGYVLYAEAGAAERAEAMSREAGDWKVSGSALPTELQPGSNGGSGS